MCVLISHWEPNLVLFLFFFLFIYLFIVGYGCNQYSVYPLSLCGKKGEYFWFIMVFKPGMYFQTGQVFLSQNGQMGSLLVFYIGCILDKQKHFM
jgi:hypothetical protein